jgi:hypothetical protein
MRRLCRNFSVWTDFVFLSYRQGCQMVSFQTKNPNLGKFWRALEWKRLVFFMENWIFWPFYHFNGHSVMFWLLGTFSPILV